jgi:uncharacterized membrane protein
MDPVAITIGISWILTGLILTGVSIPLARGQVRRNGFYGFRFPMSFQSDEAWFAINRFGGQRLIVWSRPMIAIGFISFFLRLQPHPELALIVGLAPSVFILIPCIQAWNFARRYGPKP